MPLHWPTFFTRLGSAIVFSAVMMLGLLWHAWSFLVLLIAIQALCLRDYFRLMHLIHGSGNTLTQYLSQLGALGVLLSVFQLAFLEQSALFANICLLLVLCLPVLLLLCNALPGKRKLQDGLDAIGGLFYICLPCTLLVSLYAMSWHLPLVLVLCIWMNDTMAYLVGSFIGKTPFSEISPKKTWEGTAGGAILTVLGALIAAYFIPNQSMAIYGAIALCAAVAGTAGDLFESKLKRLAGVKDSGRLMPGHGGALDRFDSLLVATPFAFVLVRVLSAFL